MFQPTEIPVRPKHPTDRIARHRRAVTLVEMMVASAVVTLIVGSMGMMAVAVRTTESVSRELNTSAQHARVLLERIEGKLRKAYANAKFPGFVVFPSQVGSQLYPDVLVVWSPSASPSDPSGMPKWSELVIYTYDTSNPNQLLEITMPSDTSAAPDLVNQNLWIWWLRIGYARAGNQSARVVLSDRLRVAAPSDSTANRRGVIRFDAVLRPTSAQWDAFLGNTVTWESLPWVQDIYSSTNGLRQSMCHLELQMRTGNDDSVDAALPFFGSAAIYYQVARP